jgi:phosphoenolpyruvate synthase/pyruvate phosphate dikinase
MAEHNRYVRWLDNLTNEDVPIVGGKNASLGDMIQSLKEQGVRVPGGFATTADAYREFLTANELDDTLKSELDKLDREEQSLDKTGKAIRQIIRSGSFPEEIAEAIRGAYREMADRYETDDVAVAVRSSATAEDLPEASFAGQQETYLNITGADDLLEACRKCYASLFIDTPKKKRRRFLLSDDEILQLARWAAVIERHYDKPMDMEWAKDGESGELFIVQARPETVQSQKEATSLKSYSLKEKGNRLVSGLAIGQAIAEGIVCVLRNTLRKNSVMHPKSENNWYPSLFDHKGSSTTHIQGDIHHGPVHPRAFEESGRSVVRAGRVGIHAHVPLRT